MVWQAWPFNPVGGECVGLGDYYLRFAEMSAPILQTRRHNQIIHFENGYKRTILNITKVWENEMTHILTDKGIEWIVNKSKVNCVEIEWLE